MEPINSTFCANQAPSTNTQIEILKTQTKASLLKLSFQASPSSKHCLSSSFLIHFVYVVASIFLNVFYHSEVVALGAF